MLKKSLFLLIAAAALSACAISVPFDITVDGTTMDLPSTVGTYFEQVIQSPTETQNEKVSLDSLTINYTFTNNTAFTGVVEIYIGLETVEDSDESDATLVISNTIPANDVLTNSVTPDILKQAVKQSAFVVGMKNFSVSGISGSDITFSYKIRAKGSYTL